MLWNTGCLSVTRLWGPWSGLRSQDWFSTPIWFMYKGQLVSEPRSKPRQRYAVTCRRHRWLVYDSHLCKRDSLVQTVPVLYSYRLFLFTAFGPSSQFLNFLEIDLVWENVRSHLNKRDSLYELYLYCILATFFFPILHLTTPNIRSAWMFLGAHSIDLV